MVSTGIPGIVFGFLHLFYCILCGLQGVPVANSYPVWSYVMITDWYHHLLTVQHTFMLISTYFYWFCEMWHPLVKWLWLVQSILAMALMHAFITPWMILCYKWLRCSFLAELFRGMLFKWKGANTKSHQKWDFIVNLGLWLVEKRVTWPFSRE